MTYQDDGSDWRDAREFELRSPNASILIHTPPEQHNFEEIDYGTWFLEFDIDGDPSTLYVLSEDDSLVDLLTGANVDFETAETLGLRKVMPGDTLKIQGR